MSNATEPTTDCTLRDQPERVGESKPDQEAFSSAVFGLIEAAAEEAEMTTPSVASSEAPSASVHKIQEELAGITLDLPLTGSGQNLNEPTAAILKPTGEHLLACGLLVNTYLLLLRA